jgi:hypothetical protein
METSVETGRRNGRKINKDRKAVTAVRTQKLMKYWF